MEKTLLPSRKIGNREIVPSHSPIASKRNHYRGITYLANQGDRPSWPGGVAAAKPQTGWWTKFQKFSDKKKPFKQTGPVDVPPLLTRRGDRGAGSTLFNLRVRPCSRGVAGPPNPPNHSQSNFEARMRTGKCRQLPRRTVCRSPNSSWDRCSPGRQEGSSRAVLRCGRRARRSSLRGHR